MKHTALVMSSEDGMRIYLLDDPKAREEFLAAPTATHGLQKVVSLRDVTDSLNWITNETISEGHGLLIEFEVKKLKPSQFRIRESE